MILKLLIVVLYSVISVNSREVTISSLESNEREFMSYGWEIHMMLDDEIVVCSGVYVAPQVFVADSNCVKKFGYKYDRADMYVVKRSINRLNNIEILQVRVHNIKFTKSQTASVAIIHTALIDHKYTKHGYVKLYSSIEDIDTTNCYAPYYDHESGNITFAMCEILFFDDRDGSDNNIYCFDRDYFGFNGGNLFCYGKSESSDKFLVGVVLETFDKIGHCSNSDFMLTTFSNLVGFKEILLNGNSTKID